ncbi:MAG: hypothetical protein V7642_1626 [Burkholderiales bacterium]|jgi:hypothetical protein
MKLIPDKENLRPLLWFFVSVYALSIVLISFLGFWSALIVAAWVYAGVSLLSAWDILPVLPRTLPGNVIRLAWACIWPYYAAKRWWGKEGSGE